MVDYTGQKFNYLTILSKFKKEGNGESFVRCRCDCGRIKEARLHHVIKGAIKTCGAYECRRKLSDGYMKDFTGQKFSRLTILSQEKKGGKWFVLCRCDCGRVKTKNLNCIRNGSTKTCGAVKCQEKLDGFAFERLKKYIGQKFNFLTVLSHYKKGRVYFFRCRCDCGRSKKVRAYYVIHGMTKSCDSRECREKAFYQKTGYHYNEDRVKDITGMKFSRLRVKKLLSEELTSNRKIKRIWLCKCDCGKTYKTIANPLLTGKVRSCGCLNTESRKEIVKKTSMYKSLIDDTMLLFDVMNLGYRINGRKIGVTFIPKSKKWKAQQIFKYQRKTFLYNTYEEALKKRLEIQNKITIPFIRRNKKVLPKDIDIDYWRILNSNVKFNPKKYEKDKNAWKIPNRL